MRVVIGLLIFYMTLFGGVHERYQEAIKLLEQNKRQEARDRFSALAKEGHAESAWYAGYLYESDDHAKRRYWNAAYYYRIAAKKEHPKAEYHLSMLTMRGYVASKSGEGFRMLKRSAKNGNQRAAYTLGYLYEHGMWIKKNAYKAKYWYRKAGWKVK